MEESVGDVPDDIAATALVGWCPFTDYTAIKLATIAARRFCEVTIAEKTIFSRLGLDAVANWESTKPRASAFLEGEFHAIGARDEATWDPDELPDALPTELVEQFECNSGIRVWENTSRTRLFLAPVITLTILLRWGKHVTLKSHRWEGGMPWPSALVMQKPTIINISAHLPGAWRKSVSGSVIDAENGWIVFAIGAS